MQQVDKNLVFKALVTLQKHKGRQNAISMKDLYEQVFEKECKDKISSTRGIRKILTELRELGFPVCSAMTGGKRGYYIAELAEEIQDFCKTMEKRAIKTLMIVSKIKKLPLPEYLGQLSLEGQKWIKKEDKNAMSVS